MQGDIGKTAANYDCYAPIFNTEFNIEFFSLKKDQCDFCEEFKNAPVDEKFNWKKIINYTKMKQLEPNTEY